MSRQSSKWKALIWTYKVLRSIVFSAIIFVVAFFSILYVALAIPPVQNMIKERIERELAAFLDSKVEINSLSIVPVNEVIIEGATIYDQSGRPCLDIGRLGAGVNLWRLLISREIEITYVELLTFNADIRQEGEDGPLNIDFIINAFKPKEEKKEPARFDLKIHNIVVRRGNVNFKNLAVTNFSADVTIPRLSNDHTVVDLRRLSFSEQSGLQVKELGGYFVIDKDNIDIRNLTLRLPQTSLEFNEFRVPKSIFDKNGATDQSIDIEIDNGRLTPSNLSFLYPPLADLDFTMPLRLKATGNRKYIAINSFEIGSQEDFDLAFSCLLTNFTDGLKMNADLQALTLKIQPVFISKIAPLLQDGNLSEKLQGILSKTGTVELDTHGRYEGQSGAIDVYTEINTRAGQLKLNAAGKETPFGLSGNLTVTIPSLDLENIVEGLPVDFVKDANVKFTGTINPKKIDTSNGIIDFSIGQLKLLGRHISAISGDMQKDKDAMTLALSIQDTNLNGELQAKAELAGEDSRWDLSAVINDFDSYNSFLLEDHNKGYELSGRIEGYATGNTLDNLTGELSLDNISVTKWSGQNLSLNRLRISVSENEEEEKRIAIDSEIADLNLTGHYRVSQIPGMIKRTLGEVCPAVFPPYDGPGDCGEGRLEIAVKNAQPLIDFFDLPIFPLTELTLTGSFDSTHDRIELATDIPYIQQGARNLITGTYLDVKIIGSEGEALINAGTVYPTKKGLLKADIDIAGRNGQYDVDISLNKGRDVMFYGDVNLKVTLEKDPEDGRLGVVAHWIPSTLHLNDADWKLDESEIVYDRNGLAVDNFSLRHDDQFILINGHNTIEGEGTILLELADIDLDYVFGTLNINHVNFGGLATGKVIAREIFSGNPIANTEGLHISQMSYNGGLLGEGDISGRLDMPRKMVAIAAIIKENGRQVADVDGGVWFGRDSLSFAFKADSVNISFMQPFMQAFSSSVKGRASGDALLCGTFSDIDMTGTLAAHDADIMIDYINARYTGSDTVYLYPGRIEVPDFTVHDKFGHTAVVNGTLEHRYFHEPVFRFRITDMDHLLVYDTTSKNNPLWYGTIFANGAGEITGKPGLVTIAADVRTERGSDFTFVLSDQQEAVKSHFLTFSDKRKAEMEAKMPKDTVPDFLQRFQRNQPTQANQTSDIFTMDIRATVNEDIRFNLIMDPIAGDKITAYGDGAMNLTYTSLTDELRLYGKYVLEKGTYNFSLQDIILKDFTIKPGSSIAFTGDPYTGVLDITAAYRVNTNLTELDRSFASDRELNRTSVPVEALLEVTGPLTSPNIGFDIDLPTVTEETAQKVRSIISTEDMMSRQVLYLVALNKFYSPEYMSTSNSGGEWASIASSTISSQIQNVIGQLTDKFTLAPSIRTDKGDFSDIEFDVALSSQLFNNRLLLNGNVGYRDPSNSSTTFVGDFDLEYLLNRKGTWRLKAYNHFNDQNYYLKSALTTQGLGIVWRKDFGRPKPAAKKEKEPEMEVEEEETIIQPANE